MTRRVPFSTNSYTDDLYFIIDEEDFDKVSQYKWYVTGQRNYYSVIRRSRKEERLSGSPQTIVLGRFILGIHISYATDGKEIDHINRNTFDNRKSNLRLVDKRINQRNKDNNTGIGTGLWGATYNKVHKTKNWQANFHIKGKTYMCGTFSSEREAHEAALEKYKEITGNLPAI